MKKCRLESPGCPLFPGELQPQSVLPGDREGGLVTIPASPSVGFPAMSALPDPPPGFR